MGVYVLKRAVGVAKNATVYGLQPVFYFPILKPLPEWTKPAERTVSEVKVLAWPTFYVPKLFKFLDGYWVDRAVRKAVRTLEEPDEAVDIDVVDAHFGYPEGVGCVRAARALGKSVFLTLRGLEADYPAGSRIRKQLEKAIRDADGCICVSHGLKELAIDAGATPDKVRVIHNAVDRDRFFPGRKIEERKALGINEQTPLIVSVGHLLDVKRHHILIRAFSIARDAVPSAKLVVIGRKMHEPDYPARLRKLVEELQLGDSVLFTGGLTPDEVATWLRASDLFALASRREGCCNAILEALCTGLPIVATPAGDNEYFVRDGENGYLTPFDDEQAMASALVRALRKEDWDRGGISAAISGRSWTNVGREVHDFFATNLQGKS